MLAVLTPTAISNWYQNADHKHPRVLRPQDSRTIGGQKELDALVARLDKTDANRHASKSSAACRPPEADRGQ